MRTLFAVLWLVLLGSMIGRAYADGPYLLRLAQRAEDWRKELPVLRQTAQAAAKDVLAGGHLWSAGPQTSFAIEALGRSGGLMLLQQYKDDAKLDAQDTVLAAVNGFEDAAALEKFQALLNKADAAGARVVVFGAADRAALEGKHKSVCFTTAHPFVDAQPDRTNEVNITSVSNVIGLWAWTGEFIAACVAGGKMPCMYESVGMPGGKDRIAALRGAPFHAAMLVQSEDAAQIGRHYLDAIQEQLRRCWTINQESFARAQVLIRATRQNGKHVRVGYMAHMYPQEMRSPQTPAWVQELPPNTQPEAGDLVLYLWYQDFPWRAWKDWAKEQPSWVLICSHAPPAEFVTDPHNVYLNPCWEITDAAVTLPGYDARILPNSGVLQAAIYWQLVELVGK